MKKVCIVLSLCFLAISLSTYAKSTALIINLLLLEENAPPTDCDDLLDSDGDRLRNCYETNTGVYVSATDTGTSPFLPDTDSDGIKDGDEVLGTLSGLNLPLLGANPLKKNIFLEYDWFNDSTECSFHSHRPTVSVINKVAQAFANAPVTNPDGSTGIEIIQDYGQGGVFSGGNQIIDADGRLNGGVNGSEFIAHKVINFSSNRNGYFHYVLFPHNYNFSSRSSGQAELPGDDSIVSLYCSNSNQNVANTIMHELGHNLNLRHGGNENCNYKPNYNSVMNYQYQFPGIDSDSSCNAIGDGILSYSVGDRINLNESNLNENAGVCGATAIDWDNDGFFSTSVVADINSDYEFQASGCGGTFTTHQDHDDWANVYFLGLNDADGRAVIAKEIITETIAPNFQLLIQP